MLSFQRPESACFNLRHGHGPPGTPNRGAHWRTTNRGFYFVIKTTWSSRHRPQLFFVGAGLRARPQDFSKGNTGSGKNGKIALPARFHSALARGGAAYANSVCPAAPGNPRRGFPTPKHSTGIFWLPSCAFSPEKNFALCAGRPKTLSLESATFEKVDETLNIIVICFYNFKSGGAD